MTLHEDTGIALYCPKHKAAFMTSDWERDITSERERERHYISLQWAGLCGRGQLTCADGEVGDVLIPEGLFVGSSVSQQTKS